MKPDLVAHLSRLLSLETSQMKKRRTEEAA
jgi:hypothetical protein